MIPHFIIDDELEEVQRTIKDLMYEKKHPELKKHVNTLKKFTRAVAFSLAKPKDIPKIVRKQIEAPVQYQLIKQPIGFDIHPIPTPGEPEKLPHDFEAKPIYSEDIGIKKPEEEIHETHIIPLIRDRFTNKILSTATLNDIYEIKEPVLNQTNRKILDKILRKKPKTPEKAWKLIEKYVRKYEGDPQHKEAIKYYVINYLFSLGRIEPLLNDKKITSIICDAPGTPIKIKREERTYKTNLFFEDKEELDKFLQLIADKTKSKLNKKSPIIDTTYRDFRFHCVLGLDITSSKFTITRIN